MHFLSHFYFYLQESPYHTLGTSLPDITRSYKRKFRLQPNLLAAQDISENKQQQILDLQIGINHHHLVDKHYHNLAFFTTEVRRLTLELNTHNWQTLNKYLNFIAHLLIEFMQDKWLMEQYADVCPRFYEHLEIALEHNSFKSYFVDHAKLLNKANFKPFKNFVERFVKVQHIYQIRNLDALIFNICRIYETTTKRPISETDRKQLVSFAQQQQKMLYPQFGAMFAQMSQLVVPK